MRRIVAWLLLGVVLLAVGGSMLQRFLSEPEPPGFDPKTVQVEVVNGCGVARLARSVAVALQKRGFDVYEVGTAERHYERTVVVDLLDPEARTAALVARVLAVQPKLWFVPIGSRVEPEVVAEPDSSRYLDVRLVLGDDYARFFPGVVVLR